MRKEELEESAHLQQVISQRHHSGDLPCKPKSRSAQTSIDEEEHLDKVFPHSTVALSVFLTMPLTDEDPLANWNSFKRTFVQQWTTIAWPTCQASPLKTAQQDQRHSKCKSKACQSAVDNLILGIFLNLSWRAVSNQLHIKQDAPKWALLYTIMALIATHNELRGFWDTAPNNPVVFRSGCLVWEPQLTIFNKQWICLTSRFIMIWY